MTEAMPFLQKAILLSYAPRPLRGGSEKHVRSTKQQHGQREQACKG